MEVPSPGAGVVGEIYVKVGDKVSMGRTILSLEESGSVAGRGEAGKPWSAPPATEAAPGSAPPATKTPGSAPPAAEPPIAAAPTLAPPPPAPPTPLPDFAGVYAGPAVRRLARELAVDLNSVKGTGDKGRITREDVKAAVTAAAAGGVSLPQVPTVDFAKFGPIETVPLSRIKRISGPRLHAAWVNVPHVTHCDEADIGELNKFRKSLDDAAKADRQGPYRVSLLPLLMKASVAALKAYPTFNGALSPDKSAMIYRHYWHIGVAVDTADGLVVAVVRDVDRKGVIELARELGTLSQKAREGKLTAAEMQGATFTISSLGGIGGTAFTPIVNAPEVAILGVVRSKMAPVWDGERFAPRLMLPLCLSYDHRVIDGAAAARFMRHLCNVVEDMRRVLL